MHDASAPSRVAALVLAAGSSTRMGAANKLLAEIDGTPMIARVVDAALASRATSVTLVGGPDAESLTAALGERSVTRVHNPDAAHGLGTSLRVGIDALPDDVEGVLVCLGDMPWLRARHLDALIEGFEEGTGAEPPICVPVHAGRRGNPLLWPARHFARLRALDGDRGARDLLGPLADEVRPVPMPDDAIHRDVDLPEDLERARNETPRA